MSKIQKFQALEKDLKNNHLAPVYLFTGCERYLINHYIDRIKQSAMDPNLETFNFNRFNEKRDNINDILSLARTVPLMAQKRVIVIDQDVGLMKSSKEEILDWISSYLNNPTDTTVLIIVDSKPDKRLRIYKEFQKQAQIIDFSKLNLTELRNWLKKLFNEYKIKISNSDITYLMDKLHYREREDASLQGIKSACQNLIDYAGVQGNIDRKIIDEVIPESVEDNVFKIVESVVTGKLAGMTDILSSFWQQGESPIALFGLLVYQLRNILKVKILLEKGYRQNEIIKETELSPFVVKKTIPLAKRYSLQRLFQIFKEAAQMDLDMKTGTVDTQFGFEVFILKLNQK